MPLGIKVKLTRLRLRKLFCQSGYVTPMPFRIGMAANELVLSQDGASSECTEFIAVVHGLTCELLLNDHDLTIAQFYGWNPAVGPDCGNLWLSQITLLSAIHAQLLTCANPRLPVLRPDTRLRRQILQRSRNRVPNHSSRISHQHSRSANWRRLTPWPNPERATSELCKMAHRSRYLPLLPCSFLITPVSTHY